MKGEDKNPSHFIHEIKTKGYNVITLAFYVFHFCSNEIALKNPDNLVHPILLQSLKSMNTVHYLWVTIWPSWVDFYELSKITTQQNAHNFSPLHEKKTNLFLLSTFGQLQRKWFI